MAAFKSWVSPIWINKFRAIGLNADQDYLKRSLKAQMREANKQNARLALILGDNEINDHIFAIKEMATGRQEEIPFSEIERYLKKYFNA